jgi:hypothetical protein
MLKPCLYIIPLLLLIIGCTNKTPHENTAALPGFPDSALVLEKINLDADWANKKEGEFKDTLILGNFDRDGKKDTAFLIVPMDPNKAFEMYGCSTCSTHIIFSNGLNEIGRSGDVGGQLENVGDLDGDGIDEIAYNYSWFTGCWPTITIYKLKNKNWQPAAYISIQLCGNTRTYKSLIRKKGNGKIETFSENANGDEWWDVYNLEADSLPDLVTHNNPWKE